MFVANDAVTAGDTSPSIRDVRTRGDAGTHGFPFHPMLLKLGKNGSAVVQVLIQRNAGSQAGGSTPAKPVTNSATPTTTAAPPSSVKPTANAAKSKKQAKAKNQTPAATRPTAPPTTGPVPAGAGPAEQLDGHPGDVPDLHALVDEAFAAAKPAIRQLVGKATAPAEPDVAALVQRAMGEIRSQLARRLDQVQPAAPAPVSTRSRAPAASAAATDRAQAQAQDQLASTDGGRSMINASADDVREMIRSALAIAGITAPGRACTES